MAWELEADRPIYQQLAEIVRQRIIKGEYPQGSRLPAVRELALEAGVNPNTMQKALLALEESGIVYSQRTSGRFVTEDEALLEQLKYQAARKHVLFFVKQMEGLGFSPQELSSLIERVLQEI
ncbi:MAG: GntR family transcriptional regulator [Lachnospiraceae bacterium]|nr:GntR family transcriptional regulator [Lachnospiraceae bacterium]